MSYDFPQKMDLPKGRSSFVTSAVQKTSEQM